MDNTDLDYGSFNYLCGLICFVYILTTFWMWMCMEPFLQRRVSVIWYWCFALLSRIFLVWLVCLDNFVCDHLNYCLLGSGSMCPYFCNLQVTLKGILITCSQTICLVQKDNCMMTSFDYNYQNPSVCCFLVQITAIVLLSSAGLTNLNNKAKPKWILVVVVKYRHRAIVLFFCTVIFGLDRRGNSEHYDHNRVWKVIDTS